MVTASPRASALIRDGTPLPLPPAMPSAPEPSSGHACFTRQGIRLEAACDPDGCPDGGFGTQCPALQPIRPGPRCMAKGFHDKGETSACAPGSGARRTGITMALHDAADITVARR